MEHILHAGDVIAAIRDTLTGKRTKAQLGEWAFKAMLADDAGTVPYDRRFLAEIHNAVYQLLFLAEGPEYELEDAELRSMLEVLERLGASLEKPSL